MVELSLETKSLDLKFWTLHNTTIHSHLAYKIIIHYLLLPELQGIKSAKNSLVKTCLDTIIPEM